MKRVFIFALAMVFGFSVIAHATLWDRGGGLIYDDVLNITWLRDANYAKTSGYNADGLMTWPEAVAWASQLVYGGYDDWRLPQALPVNGTTYNYVLTCDGSTDMAYNISAPGSAYPQSTASEMAYMYYNNLGNNGYFDISCRGPQAGWNPTPNATFTDGNGKTVSFQNLQAYFYWSGTECDLYPFSAWQFLFDLGRQDGAYKTSYNFYAWAVRDGDVSPVSIDIKPAIVWVGLKNSDDQGTQFDLRAELYVNDALVSEGETLCITGVTRNPSYAKEVTVPFGPVLNEAYNPGGALSLRVLTRIGTNPDGSKCSGPGGSHNNAVGLRLYYDSPTRPSRFGAEISPDPLMDYFLHSASGNYFLNDVSPTGTVKYKDSSGVNYKNGNPWKEIGTWQMELD